MTHVDVLPALLGGVMIGLASVWLLALHGRLAGLSGIVHGLIGARDGELAWRAWFVVGTIASGFVALAVAPQLVPAVDIPWPRIVIAGGLVGLGTKIANGCTSGHGVCGLGRRSPRSLVAVLTFMLVAIATVAVMHRLTGVAT